jgi:NAD(P)-dependent dehydrogenase (short-subunit alcohol dehydrogenase family)
VPALEMTPRAGSANGRSVRERWNALQSAGTVRNMPTALLIGNSDGIGLALTELLLGEGWRVVGLSRSASRVQVAGYVHHVVDVRESAYPARLSAALAAEMPDVCVYCAAIGEFLDIETLATDRAVFETNLMGLVATAQVVVPAMVGRGRGHFVGLSSQGDAFADPRAPSYSASKAAFTVYLEGLAPACRARGVYVTNVRFGFVDTKMAKAPVRPFMMSTTCAAQRVRRCLDRKPVRDTYPKRMALLLWLHRRLPRRLRGG